MIEANQEKEVIGKRETDKGIFYWVWMDSMRKYLLLSFRLLYSTKNGEGVETSNFRTSTGQKFQNVEIVFLVDQNIEIRTSKMSFELIRTPTIRTSKIALKIDFRRSDPFQRHR